LSLQVITDMASTGIKPNKDVNGDGKLVWQKLSMVCKMRLLTINSMWL